MQNMFLKNSPRQVLIQRNIILGTVEWSLGSMTLVIDLMVLVRYFIDANNPPNPEYIVLAVFLLLLFIRFFIWSYWYYYIDNPKDNEKGLDSFRKNEEPKQRKLFTHRKHKVGQRNPLF